MVVTLTAAALAAEIGATEERATRLLAVATEAVTRYAPNAPEALANEATIRFAGYLAQCRLRNDPHRVRRPDECRVRRESRDDVPQLRRRGPADAFQAAPCWRHRQ